MPKVISISLRNALKASRKLSGSLIEIACPDIFVGVNADTDLPAAGRIDVALGEKRTKGAYQFVIGIRKNLSFQSAVSSHQSAVSSRQFSVSILGSQYSVQSSVGIRRDAINRVSTISASNLSIQSK